MRASYHDLILECIKQNSPLSVTIKDISKQTKISYKTVREHMAQLVETSIVKKIPDRGRGHRYFYIGEPHKNHILPVDAEVLKKFLLSWAEHKWEPKIFVSAANLPYSIAKIYELAVEVLFGSTVYYDSLNEVRVSLFEFKKDLEQTLGIVNGILAVGEIWNEEKFVEYLLSEDDIHPESVRRLAFTIRQIN